MLTGKKRHQLYLRSEVNVKGKKSESPSKKTFRKQRIFFRQTWVFATIIKFDPCFKMLTVFYFTWLKMETKTCRLTD